MTEQEAEVMAKRMTRIWANETLLVKWRLWKGNFEFRIAMTSDTYFFAFGKEKLMLSLDRRQINKELPQARWHDGLKSGFLYYDNKNPAKSIYTRINSLPTQSFEQFADEWMPFFRRGCWLSGYDIEASAHEKVEWMRSFSREELESWNLKM